MRPGWYQDPSGRFPLRWHDGIQWTPQVMDGWQRPAVDPLPAMMDTPPGAATTTAPPPVPPPLVSPLSGHPPAPAPVPGAPVIPTLRPSRIGPSKEIGAENAAAKADVPPAQWRVTRPARYAVIGVAGMMMALGLFALPWVEAVGGKGVITYRYPKLANGEIDRYNDLPPQYKQNVDVADAPFDRKEGDEPALNDAEIADVIAFLKTLTDGYQPDETHQEDHAAAAK